MAYNDAAMRARDRQGEGAGVLHQALWFASGWSSSAGTTGRLVGDGGEPEQHRGRHEAPGERGRAVCPVSPAAAEHEIAYKLRPGDSYTALGVAVVNSNVARLAQELEDTETALAACTGWSRCSTAARATTRECRYSIHTWSGVMLNT